MASVIANLKAAVGSVLKHSPATYAAASRLLYRIDRSFRTLSHGTPEAIHEAWITAQRTQADTLGDYYEFGLFRGFTLWQAEQSARKLGLQTPHFWGFDSFQGLPAISGTDAQDGIFFEGQFACSREEVLRNLGTHGADLSRITLIEGFFEESLTSELKHGTRFGPVGIALIDCDLYSSTRSVLRWLGDLLQDKSILLFDDWKTFGGKEDRGQPLAFREFLQRGDWRAQPYVEFGSHGRGFVMERLD